MKLSYASEAVQREVLCYRIVFRSPMIHVSLRQLAKMYATGFIERNTSVVCFRSLLPFLMESLTRMTTWELSDANNKARSYYSITKTDTIVGLVVLENTCSIMLPTTRLLHAKSLHLVEAMSDHWHYTIDTNVH